MAKASVANTAAGNPNQNLNRKSVPASSRVEVGNRQGQSKYFQLFINSWIFLPVLFYIKIANQYALNLPIGDDYNAVLQFLNDYKTAAFADKFGILLRQHNEHRILSSRLIFLLYDTIAGNINFINLIYIANLQLLVIFCICVHFIKKAIPKYWNIASVIVCFCLFDLSNYDNGDFAMCGMQNYGVIMLFMLSMLFYSFSNGKRYIGWALFCQVLCIYSSGNGLIASVALILFNVFQRDKVKIIASVAAALVFGPLYFIHYVPAADQSTYGHDLSKMVPFFFHLTGGHFGYENGVVAGVALLVVLAIVLPITGKLKIKEHTLPFLCVIAFILASDAVVAVFRSNVKMLDSYSSRYLIYPNMLAAIVFVLVQYRMQAHKYKWAVTITLSVAMLYMYTLNYTYGEAGFARYKFRLENREFFYDPEKQEEARQITDKSCQLGIYCIKDER